MSYLQTGFIYKKQQIKLQEDNKDQLEKRLKKLESQPTEGLIIPHPTELPSLQRLIKS